MSTHRPHIPDWKTVKLGEVTEIIKGGTPSRNVEKYFRGDIAWAIPSDITALDSFLYIDDTETHITEEALSNSAARLLPAGTVLLTSRATIGETAIATVPMATNQGFANFICCEALLNVFLAYYLRYIKEKLNDLASGSTFKEITKGTLLNIEIPHLPLSEQRAIAEALSDVDGLLNALEALIAKKRAIKQATMQQLLTGKTRLPGFSGEWETKRVSEFGDVVTGATPSTKVNAFWDGPYPWITPTDITSKRDMTVSERMITQEGLNAIRTLSPNTVLVTCIASIGKNAILKTKGSCNQQINAVIPNSAHNAEFLYYLFEFNANFLLANAGITATNIVSKSAFSKLVFEVPLFDEQIAITSVLSDMDAEITALEQRRDKTRAIKQGMMQQLLTGRVRLSESRICTDDTD